MIVLYGKALFVKKLGRFRRLKLNEKRKLSDKNIKISNKLS
jgi:hypothetical protein